MDFVRFLTHAPKKQTNNYIMTFVTIFLFTFFSSQQSFKLNIRLLKNIILAVLLFIVSFNTINNIILGRKAEKKSSLISIYIGAEIKNFDIYIQQSNSDNSNNLGIYTFRKADKIYIFQNVGLYELGNVYTQFHPFHKDFGAIGVFILTFCVASFSMYFYNKALLFLKKPYKQNKYLYMYSYMTLSIFMSFFSSRVTEQLSKGFLYYFVGSMIFIQFFDKYFRTKSYN